MTENTFVSNVQKLAPELYRTAYLYLGSEEKALDAVDKAVFRCLGALGALGQKQSFEIWLMRTLLGCCRELSGSKNGSPAEEMKSGSGFSFNAPTDRPIPERIAQLPAELKEPLILCAFTQLSPDDLSKVLELPQEKLNKQLSCARERLGADDIAGCGSCDENLARIPALFDTPLKLDFTAERAQLRLSAEVSRRKSRRALVAPLGAVAAICAVLILLINLSPAFSDWLSGLPHFRAIVDAVTFSLPEVKSAAFYFCGGVARL